MAACEPSCTCGRHRARPVVPTATNATSPPVAVLVPYRPSGHDRVAAWEHVCSLWAARHPTWQVVAADSPADGPWCKAAAVAAALAQTDAPVLVVADADVWCDGVGAAVDAVRAGAAWAVPHYRVLRLTSSASATVYETGLWPTRRTSATYAQPPYPGRIGGGMTVLSRDLYASTPLDPRFTGWGQEDEAWALALRRIAGKEWRGVEDLWHLWHKPQPRRSRTVGSRESYVLYRRYATAARDLTRMRGLVAEYAG